MPDITWTGSVDGDFTDLNNWVTTSTGATAGAAPANGDTLRWNDKATVGTTINLTGGTLTTLEIIVTSGMRFEIGTASDSLEGVSATSIVYAGLGQFGKFAFTTAATLRSDNGLCVISAGTVGATLMELSNGRLEIGASATASASGVWKLRSGVLDMQATATADEPDIYVGRDARVLTERDLGNVWNMGSVTLNKLAEVEAAHVFTNLMGGSLDHRSSGTIPTLEAITGSSYTMANAHRPGAITLLNEWDGAVVNLRGPGGDIVAGTHNFIGKPPLGAGGSGRGIVLGGGSG